MRTQPFLLLLVAVLAFLTHDAEAAAGVARKAAPLVGGWKPIGDVKDPKVQDLGAFAVSEYNKKINGFPLVFVRVVSGETQVVSGVNYRLVLEAKDASTLVTRSYVAVVWEQAWRKFRKLTSFHPKV